MWVVSTLLYYTDADVRREKMVELYLLVLSVRLPIPACHAEITQYVTQQLATVAALKSLLAMATFARENRQDSPRTSVRLSTILNSIPDIVKGFGDGCMMAFLAPNLPI